MHCLQAFSTKEVLAKHKENCFEASTEGKAIRCLRREVRSSSKITTGKCQCHLLFTQILKPSQKKYLAANQVQKSHLKYQQHTACSYSYKLVCCYDDKYSKPVKIYRGEEPMNKFMDEILKEVDYCKAIMRKHKHQLLYLWRAIEGKRCESKRSLPCHR